MLQFGAKNTTPQLGALAKMNLAIRRIEANLGDGSGDTLRNDHFP